jgi:hypothetical protein
MTKEKNTNKYREEGEQVDDRVTSRKDERVH